MSRGIILGGATKAARKTRVWLPGGATKALKEDVISTCITPTGRNPDGSWAVCGAKFYKGQERLVEKHAGECLARHEEEIRDYIESVHPSIMKPWDTEYATWLRQNREALLEGRMKA
jgi:hypothetical protein